MKKNFLTLVFAVWVTALFSQTLSIDPTNSKIQYAGRMSFANPYAPDFSMPGTSVAIAFSGTALDVNLTSSGTSYIYVIVDGNDNPYEREVIAVSGPNNVVNVASGLTNGNHTVKIVKVNEYDTKVSFLGCTIHGSAILDVPARAPHKIEFYGDSNPSGWSAWDVRDEGHANLSGGYHTYPGITARMLNAEYSNFAAGGWGTTANTNRMDFNDAYNRIHIGERTSSSNTWNFANNYWNFTPEVIVINLGANDYYNGATKEDIIAGWNQLVTSIRQHCPQSHIVMANSYGWAFDEPADYVHEFVALRHNSGDANVSYVKFPWLWSDYHAVINEHAGFANILAAHIANVMGWSAPTPSPLSSFGENGNVGNGSFESSLIAGFADGWRPFASWSYPEYVTDAANAFDGTSFIRCPDTYGVMHANDAAEGDVFEVSVWAKTIQGNRGRLKYEFRNQGQSVIVADMIDVNVGSAWQKLSLTTNTAPAGTWQINIILEGIDGSTVDFDLVEMRKVTGGDVPVTGVQVSPLNASLLVNETAQLTAMVEPANATNKAVSWQSSNENVATVNSSGLVTAVGEGLATITVTTNDGSYTANSQVQVTSGSGAISMHVLDLIMGTVQAGGPNVKATATVYIHDDLGNPVANATVTGTFSGDINETVWGTTDSEGIAVITSYSKKKNTINCSFCVDNVEQASLVYNEADNLITCSSAQKSGEISNTNIENMAAVSVYPNPAFNEVTIISLNNNLKSVQIFDMSGKSVMLKSAVNASRLKINVSDFESGIYLVHINNEETSRINKLVVK